MKQVDLINHLTAIEVLDTLPANRESYAYDTTQQRLQQDVHYYRVVMHTIRMRLEDDCMYKTHQALEWLSILGVIR